MKRLVREVPVSSEMIALVSRLVLATHPGEASAPEKVRRFVRWGASPRAGQALILAAKARALVRGRIFVAEEDVASLAAPALRHRLILNYEAVAAGARPDEIVDEALERARQA